MAQLTIVADPHELRDAGEDGHANGHLDHLAGEDGGLGVLDGDAIHHDLRVAMSAGRRPRPAQGASGDRRRQRVRAAVSGETCDYHAPSALGAAGARCITRGVPSPRAPPARVWAKRGGGPPAAAPGFLEGVGCPPAPHQPPSNTHGRHLCKKGLSHCEGVCRVRGLPGELSPRLLHRLLSTDGALSRWSTGLTPTMRTTTLRDFGECMNYVAWARGGAVGTVSRTPALDCTGCPDGTQHPTPAGAVKHSRRAQP